MKSTFRIGAMFICGMASSFCVSAQEVKWVDVNLETAGTLGVEILYQVDRLSDVTHLRISGPINDADWNNIKNLTNIQIIDMGKAITKEMPGYSFDGRSSLTSITLPQSLETIGEYAFRSSSLEKISFPSSLSEIKYNAFQNSAITSVAFADDCNLLSMGNSVFYNCSNLKDVTFPKAWALAKLPDETFRSCKSLQSITLPEGIKEIGSNSFQNTTSLTVINLPQSLETIGSWCFYESGIKSITLPPYVYSLGSYCFSYCQSLEEITIPSGVHELSYTFTQCKALNHITCKALVPPSINNAFSYVPMGSATLTVPDVALPDYKLDESWLGFSIIEGGATSDFWDIKGTVSLTNNRRLDGTPSVTIEPEGALRVGGNAAFPMHDFMMKYDFTNYYGNGVYPALVNSSPAMTAENISSVFSIGRVNKWYFLSLPYDVKVSDIRHSDPTAYFAVRYYDGAIRAAQDNTGNSWQDFAPDAIIRRGTAFIFNANTTGEITFPAIGNGKESIFNPNSFTIELAQNKALSSANSGWNFIGNPFPGFYDMYYAMLECPITVYDFYNNRYNAYSLIDDDIVLTPSDGFFVQASDELSEIIFSNLGCQLSATLLRESENMRMPAYSSRRLFDVNFVCNGLSDHTRVVLNDDASCDYEASRDASKFFSAEVPQIYTILSGNDYLAINERPEMDGVVRLGVYSPAAGEASISMSRIDGTAILRDLLTGEICELGENDSYRFHIEKAGNVDYRFEIILRAPAATGIESVNAESNVRILVENNIISISGGEGRQIVITSTDGKVFVNDTANSSNITYSLPAGLYIVKVGGVSTKCIIK